MTKADAVRAAMAEGVEKPQDACEWIKTKFGIDITPAHFSSYKSGFKKKEGGGASEPSSTSSHGKSQPSGSRVGNSNPVELAKQVRALVQQHGAAAVKGMVEVFE